jgi:hypothetical protein
MATAPVSVAARALKREYAKLSRQGYFGDAYVMNRLSRLCDDLLEIGPPPVAIVAFILKVLFDSLSEGSHTLLPNQNSARLWPRLDAAILEAVAYLGKTEEPADAIRIGSELITLGRAWLGR